MLGYSTWCYDRCSIHARFTTAHNVLNCLVPDTSADPHRSGPGGGFPVAGSPRLRLDWTELDHPALTPPPPDFQWTMGRTAGMKGRYAYLHS